MFKLPVRLLDAYENMTPEQQEEFIKHLAVKLEAEKRQLPQTAESEQDLVQRWADGKTLADLLNAGGVITKVTFPETKL
jgi:transketolase